MIFSIAMGAEYLSYVKSIATFAPTFYGYIISFLASVFESFFYRSFSKATEKTEKIIFFFGLDFYWSENEKFIFKN